MTSLESSTFAVGIAPVPTPIHPSSSWRREQDLDIDDNEEGDSQDWESLPHSSSPRPHDNNHTVSSSSSSIPLFSSSSPVIQKNENQSEMMRASSPSICHFVGDIHEIDRVEQSSLDNTPAAEDELFDDSSSNAAIDSVPNSSSPITVNANSSTPLLWKSLQPISCGGGSSNQHPRLPHGTHHDVHDEALSTSPTSLGSSNSSVRSDMSSEGINGHGNDHDDEEVVEEEDSCQIIDVNADSTDFDEAESDRTGPHLPESVLYNVVIPVILPRESLPMNATATTTTTTTTTTTASTFSPPYHHTNTLPEQEILSLISKCNRSTITATKDPTRIPRLRMSSTACFSAWIRDDEAHTAIAATSAATAATSSTPMTNRTTTATTPFAAMNAGNIPYYPPSCELEPSLMSVLMRNAAVADEEEAHPMQDDGGCNHISATVLVPSLIENHKGAGASGRSGLRTPSFTTDGNANDIVDVPTCTANDVKVADEAILEGVSLESEDDTEVLPPVHDVTEEENNGLESAVLSVDDMVPNGDPHTESAAIPDEDNYLDETSVPFESTDDECEPKTLLVLFSKLSIDRTAVSRQERSFFILAARGIPYDTIDGSDASCKETRNNLFVVSGQYGVYPQFFLVGDTLEYWGDYDRLEEGNDMGTLSVEFGASESSNDSINDTNLIDLTQESGIETLSVELAASEPSTDSIKDTDLIDPISELEAEAVAMKDATESVNNTDLIDPNPELDTEARATKNSADSANNTKLIKPELDTEATDMKDSELLLEITFASTEMTDSTEFSPSPATLPEVIDPSKETAAEPIDSQTLLGEVNESVSSPTLLPNNESCNEEEESVKVTNMLEPSKSIVEESLIQPCDCSSELVETEANSVPSKVWVKIVTANIHESPPSTKQTVSGEANPVDRAVSQTKATRPIFKAAVPSASTSTKTDNSNWNRPAPRSRIKSKIQASDEWVTVDKIATGRGQQQKCVSNPDTLIGSSKESTNDESNQQLTLCEPKDSLKDGRAIPEVRSIPKKKRKSRAKTSATRADSIASTGSVSPVSAVNVSNPIDPPNGTSRVNPNLGDESKGSNTMSITSTNQQEKEELNTKTDITVYGATSFVAQHVLTYLSQVSLFHTGPLAITLAGRNTSKLDALKTTCVRKMENLLILNSGSTGKCIFDVFVADCENGPALDEMAKRTGVVLNCAGPFGKYGDKVVRGCAQMGTDYVDITGEVEWTSEMREMYGAIASKSGSRIISFCGFDSIPSDIAVYAAVCALRKAYKGRPAEIVKATTWHSADGSINGGTLHTALGMRMKLLNFVRRVPYFVNDPLILAHPKTKNNPNTQVTKNRLALAEWYNIFPLSESIFALGVSIPFFMAVVNTKVVHASSIALKYGQNFVYHERFVPVGYKHTTALGLVSVVPALITLVVGTILFLIFKLPFIGSKLAMWILPPGSGSSERACSAGYAHVYAEVTTAPRARTSLMDKAYCMIKFQGDPGNYVTAQCVSEAALALVLNKSELPQRSEDGFGTPAELLGPVLLKRLKSTTVRPVVLETKSLLGVGRDWSMHFD